MLNPPELQFGLIKGTFGKFVADPNDKEKLKIVGYEGSYTLEPELDDDDVITYPGNDLITTPPTFSGTFDNGSFTQVGISSESGGSDVSGFTYKLTIQLKDDKRSIERVTTGIFLPTYNGSNAVEVSDIMTAGPAAPIYIGNNDRVIAAILRDPTSESYAAVVAINGGGPIVVVPPDGEAPGDWEARLTAFTQQFNSALAETNTNVDTKAPKASPEFTGQATFEKLDADEFTGGTLSLTGKAEGQDATTATGFVTKRQLDEAALGDIDLTGYQKKLPAAGAGKVLAATGPEAYQWVTPSADTVGLGSVDNTADKDKPVSGPQQTAIDKAVGKGGNGPSSALTWNTNTGKSFAASNLGDTFRVAISVATTVTLNNPAATDSGTITLDITKTGSGVVKFTNAIIWNNRNVPTFTAAGNYLVTLAWTGSRWYGVVGVFGA